MNEPYHPGDQVWIKLIDSITLIVSKLIDRIQ